MYVTRPLSMFQKNPSALSWPPPEGPNSGILVIEDEEAEQQYTCFGLCKSNELKDLPQTKNLTLRYSSGTGQNRRVSYFYASLIPVLNQPLSSNRYYVIKRRGSHKGTQCLKRSDLALVAVTAGSKIKQAMKPFFYLCVNLRPIRWQRIGEDSRVLKSLLFKMSDVLGIEDLG
uniref:Uncharacterized protein n=1 Tax=Quercus lobata TaxID=97700 RepID=A0A7N2MUT5_QUELO